MCKNQQHVGMLEQFYTTIVIVVALKKAASKVLPNGPKQKHLDGPKK